MEKSRRRHRSRKTGLPPGTLVHIGEKRNFDPRISVFQYSAETFRELTSVTVDELPALKEQSGIYWINIDGIHKIDLIENIGKLFNLHPLTMEDIVNNEQRPKVEEHEHYLYFVLKMLFPKNNENNRQQADRINVEQVSIILGGNYVLSFQESIDGDVFNSIRERIRNNHGKMRKAGADYLAYTLMDAIVDHYFLILEKIGEKLEILEADLLADPNQKTLYVLQVLKRDMIGLRKSIWPLREVVSSLQRLDTTLIHDGTRKYLRDVYDHTIHVIDSIEAYRDLLGGMLEIYLSSVSNHLNGIMKVLTMIATIFIPLTFIVGVYGMNFKHMPELEWEHGYLLTWIIMITITSAMLIYFRRKKWI